MSTKAEAVETEVITQGKQPLILTGTGYELQIAPEFIKLRDDIIAELDQLGEIKSAADDAKADALIKRAAQIRITTEKSRVEVKAPALAFGKDTDTKAKNFIDCLTAKEEAAKKKRGTYAQAVLEERNRILREEQAKREAEEKARREAEAAEAARIEAERVAAEAAEKARQQAEEAAFNATSPEEEAAAKAAAEEAERVAVEAAALEAKRKAEAEAEAARVAALPVAAPTFIPEAPKGVKMIADFEVTDIDALYRHNAGLVTMEARRKEILEAIARGMIGETPPQIPGLRVFMKPHVR